MNSALQTKLGKSSPDDVSVLEKYADKMFLEELYDNVM